MEFFLVEFFTEFSSEKHIKLLVPSIIPFITRACGRQPFIVEILVAESSLLKPQAKALNVESRELKQRGEKERGPRRPCPLWVLRILVSLLEIGTFHLTKTITAEKCRWGMKAKQREIGNSRTGRGLGEVTQCNSPCLLRMPIPLLMNANLFPFVLKGAL